MCCIFIATSFIGESEITSSGFPTDGATTESGMQGTIYGVMELFKAVHMCGCIIMDNQFEFS